jgi:hypothetical protein
LYIFLFLLIFIETYNFSIIEKKKKIATRNFYQRP